jgi:hypothetical protein
VEMVLRNVFSELNPANKCASACQGVRRQGRGLLPALPSPYLKFTLPSEARGTCVEYIFLLSARKTSYTKENRDRPDQFAHDKMSA